MRKTERAQVRRWLSGFHLRVILQTYYCVFIGAAP